MDTLLNEVSEKENMLNQDQLSAYNTIVDAIINRNQYQPCETNFFLDGRGL